MCACNLVLSEITETFYIIPKILFLKSVIRYFSLMQHHVYFWLKEEHQNDADKKAFEKGLQLCVDVPSVAGGGWGKSAATPERHVTDKSWDYSLYLTFDSVDKHNEYQEDPQHDEFVNTCKDKWSKVVIMDVE